MEIKKRKDKSISVRVSNEDYSKLEYLTIKEKENYRKFRKPVNKFVYNLIMEKIKNEKNKL